MESMTKRCGSVCRPYPNLEVKRLFLIDLSSRQKQSKEKEITAMNMSWQNTIDNLTNHPKQ